jgi:3-methyladenine DNA glycosylase Tag
MTSLLSEHGNAESVRQSMDDEKLFTAMIITMFIAGLVMGFMLDG